MSRRIKNTFLQEIIVSAILATYDDEKIIEMVLKCTNKILSAKYPNYEILVIDNNSKDDTLNKVKSLCKKIPNIRVIALSKTYTLDITYTCGLDNCIGDYAALFDFHMVSPEIIPHALDKLIDGLDMVTAQPRDKVFSKWSASSLLLSVLKWLSKNKFDYQPLHLLVLNRKVINTITRIKRKSRNFIYLNDPLGFSKTTVDYFPIKEERSSLKFINFIELLLRVTDLIISNSFKPIRFLAGIGIFLSLVLLFSVIAAAVSAVFLNTQFISKDWIFVATALGVMLFILFSLLGLISEYLIRVLDESRDEPLYYINEEIDKSSITTRRKRRLNVI